MYQTSEAYKAAMCAPVRSERISGYLGAKPLSDDNIISGTLYIDNQCVSSDEDITLGACVIGEMGFDLKDSLYDADYYYGKRITLTYSQKLADGTYEDIPLGVFTVNNQTTRKDQETISIRAYDNMIKFDVQADKHNQVCTPEELLRIMCGICGVGFGGIDADLPNQDITLVYSMSFYAEYIVTVRDAIKYICELLCGYGTIGRDGRLYIHSLVPRSEADLTLTAAQRKSSKLSDKALVISGVIAEITKYLLDTTQMIQYPEKPNAGKLLQISDNPFMQQMESEQRRACIAAIAETAMQITYLPMSANTFGDPSLDIGDTVRFTGYICGDGIDTVITHNYWRYRGTQELQSVADPNDGVYVPDLVQTTADDYIYEIVENSYVRIVRYIGADNYIITPETIEGLPVTELLESSFTGTGVRKVVIPDGVEVIA